MKGSCHSSGSVSSRSRRKLHRPWSRLQATVIICHSHTSVRLCTYQNEAVLDPVTSVAKVPLTEETAVSMFVIVSLIAKIFHEHDCLLLRSLQPHFSHCPWSCAQQSQLVSHLPLSAHSTSSTLPGRLRHSIQLLQCLAAQCLVSSSSSRKFRPPRPRSW